MTRYSNSTQWVSWLGTIGMFLVFSSPLQADGPVAARDPAGVEEILQAHLSERGLIVYQKVVADLDDDGHLDLVAHVGKAGEQGDDSVLVVALGDPAQHPEGSPRIVLEVPDGMLCPHCPVGGGARPSQSLLVRDGKLEICESWGATWFASECAQTVLSPNGSLLVERHTETSGWNDAPSERTITYDFLAHRGRRSYVSHPLEAGFPVLEHTAEFAVVEARHTTENLALDGLVNEDPWIRSALQRFEASNLVGGAEHWKGAVDLGFTLRGVWRDDALWLAIEVEDDAFVVSDGNSFSSITRADHVELWIDLAEGLEISGNARWVDEHRRVYLEDPVRHEPDNTLFNIALIPRVSGTVAKRFLPRAVENETPLQVRAETTIRESGYTLEVAIPASFFGTSSLRDYEGRRQGVGLTIAVHDIDSNERPFESTKMATSELVWGDPYSMGVLVMPQSKARLPTFPFDWERWLD